MMALGAGLMFGPAQAAPPVQCAVATIQVEPGAAGITLTGRAVALARCQFTASLTVERADFSNFDEGVLIPELGRDFINPSGTDIVFSLRN